MDGISYAGVPSPVVIARPHRIIILLRLLKIVSEFAFVHLPRLYIPYNLHLRSFSHYHHTLQ